MSKKILIIEDDEAISQNLSTALNGDYEIFQALTGTSGLEMAKENNPDLILLDYMLPDISGFEVMRQLKEEEKFNEIPIVILTNRTDSKTISGILAAGGKEFWSKTDLSINDIVQKVREIVEEY